MAERFGFSSWQPWPSPTQYLPWPDPTWNILFWVLHSGGGKSMTYSNIFNIYWMICSIYIEWYIQYIQTYYEYLNNYQKTHNTHSQQGKPSVGTMLYGRGKPPVLWSLSVISVGRSSFHALHERCIEWYVVGRGLGTGFQCSEIEFLFKIKNTILSLFHNQHYWF